MSPETDHTASLRLSRSTLSDSSCRQIIGEAIQTCLSSTWSFRGGNHEETLVVFIVIQIIQELVSGGDFLYLMFF